MEKKKPLLSILIPTHNRPDVLVIALKSVLYQSFQDFEVLVVGDGCTDNTAEIVSSFKDDRFKWYDLLKAPNFGYANRNIALREARGKYIGFMAHDDILFYDHFKKCVDALEADEKKEIVCTRPLWITEDGMIIPVEFNFNNPATLDDFITRTYNAMPAACVVHKRECFDKYGYWNDQLTGCGDWDMWARIIEGGGRKNFIFITEPTILHFIAIWRRGKKPGFKEAINWIDFYKSSELIPNELIVEIPENIIEQRIVWNMVSGDPKGWAEKIRKSAITVFDQRILYDAGRIRQLELQIRKLKQKIDRIYNSYSWKIGRGITKVFSRSSGVK